MMKEVSVALLISMLLFPLSLLNNQHINILNPKETPLIGSQWTVYFDTEGAGVLEIENLNPDDVVFLGLYYKDGDNWFRTETFSEENTARALWHYKSGKAVFKVVNKGFHTLKFTFGNEDFAYNSAGQAVQLSYLLDISDPIFLYEQQSFNDTNYPKFSGAETIYSGVSLPKNISIIYAYLNITGKITYSQSPSPGTVYDLKIGDIISQTGNETAIAVGIPSFNYFRLLNNTFNVNWSYPASGPAIAIDIGDVDTSISGIEIFGGSLDNNVTLLNSSGGEIWHFTAATDIRDVAVGELNSTYDGLEVVFGLANGNITVLNATGHYIWSAVPSGEVNTVDIGNVNDSAGNEVVLGDASGNIKVYNATGSEIWVETISGATINSIHLANISDDDYDEIIIGDSLGYVRSLNASRKWWNTAVGDPVFTVSAGEIDSSSPGLEVAAGTDAGILYSFNSTGHYLWDYTIGPAINTIDIGNITAEVGQEVLVGTGSGGTGSMYVFNFDNFPTDSFIDVGDDVSSGYYDWTQPGKMRNNSFIDNNTMWQEIVDYMAGCDKWLCNLSVSFNSTSPGEFAFDLNITYDYDLSNTFKFELIDVWSRIDEVYANETVGNQVYNISFPMLPQETVEVKYIVWNDTATECDFNRTKANITTVDSKNVCNVTPIIINVTTQQIPKPVLFWDNNMSAGVPIIMNMSGNYYSAPWRLKDITIWNDTTIYSATSEIFYNITANISFVDQGFAEPILFTADWWSNGTWYNITPSGLSNTCNTTSVDYEMIDVDGYEFWVCGQDLDDNNVMDYIKWKQPQSFFNDSSMINYNINGTGNTPPTLIFPKVSPASDIWGTFFNYTIQVNDSETDPVNVTLWIYTPITGWVKNETKEITSGSSTNATIHWNLTAPKEWTNSTENNGYKFFYRDPYIGGYNTSEYYGPAITKHEVKIEYVSGNNSEVNRTGTNTTELLMRIYDSDFSTYVGADANCTINVSVGGNNYPYMSTNKTNSTGFCLVNFDPSGEYAAGIRGWVGGLYDDWYYNNNVTDLYNLDLRVVGSLDATYTLTPVANEIVARYNESERHYSNITWDITSVVEDNGTATTGYTTWIYWQEQLINDSGQAQGVFDIPDDNNVGDIGNFTILVFQQYFNNFTELSDYTVYGKMVFNLSDPQNLTQIHRSYGVLNLSVNVTDELETFITDAAVEWWLPEGACDAEYNMSNGTYICEYNPDDAITPSEYNWTINTSRQYYDNVYDIERLWLHINGSLNISFELGTLTQAYFRDQTKNMTAFLRDENNAWVSVENYNCTWYIDNNDVGNSTTNSTGVCLMNWTSTCSDTLGGHLINVSLWGGQTDFYTFEGPINSTTLNLNDTLYVTVEYPSNGSILHRTETTWLNATVYDTCGYPDSPFKLVWYNVSGNITDGTGINETWTVPADYPLSLGLITANATGGNYTQNGDMNRFYFYGWSEPVWIYPTGEITFGVYYNLTCQVVDSNTSAPIPGYNVSFWKNETTAPISVALGANFTDTSNAYAFFNWTPIQPNWYYGLRCNITDNQTLWYNSSGIQTTVGIYARDNNPPNINGTSISNSTIEANYQYTLITANVTDDVGISNVWAEIENETSPENRTMSFHHGNRNTGEIWELYYYPPTGGLYNVTIWVNDTSHHNVSSIAGNFTVIGYTTSKLWMDQADIYHVTGRVTETSPDTYWVDTYVNNTGNATMYNTTLQFTGPSGIYFSTSDLPIYTINLGNITPGSSETHSSTRVKTTTYPSLGNNTVTITLKWTNPNLTDWTVQNTTIVNLTNTTYIELTNPDAGGSVIPSTIVDYIPNGTSRISGNISIEAFGTTELLDVNITFGSGDLDVSWINFTPFWNVPYIAKNDMNTTSLNVTVPSGESPAVYTRVIIANATGSTQFCNQPGESCVRQFTYELHVIADEWNVTPPLINRTVGQNSFGTMGTILITNRGNDFVEFNVSVDGANGNVTTNTSYFSLDSFETAPVLVLWNATGAEPDNYTAEVVFDVYNDPSRVPQQLNVTVFLNVTDVTVDIESPTSFVPETDVLENDIMSIKVNAQLGGTPLGTGDVLWFVSIGGELIGNSVVGGVQCKSMNPVFNSTGDDKWDIDCTAPYIEGNVIYNLLYIQGNITAQSIITNDYEIDAIVYRDITPPLFTGINISPIQPGEVLILYFNVSDNTGVAQGDVSATLRYESGSPSNITANLSHEYGDRWNCTLYNRNSIGDYWINITAIDSSSYQHMNSTLVWFDVYNPIYFDGTMKDPLANNVTTIFNFYVPASESPIGQRVLAHKFNTSQKPDFNETIHKRVYDLEIKAFNHTLEYSNLNANIAGGNISDYITLDDIPASAINVNPDITYYSITGIYVGNLFSYDSAGIRINFSASTPYITHKGLGDFYDSRLTVYRCDNWNFSSVSCLGSWTSVGGTVDNTPTSPNYETIYLTATSTSAFGLIQCLRDNCAGTPTQDGGTPQIPYYPPSSGGTSTVCGNGICETGENSENCPQDCATAELLLGAETTLSEVYLKPGENKTYQLSISNTHTEAKTVSIAISGDIVGFVAPATNLLTIPGQSSRIIELFVLIPEDTTPGTYTGYITLTSEGRVRNIPVTMIVSIEGAMQLDLALNALTKQVVPNSTFKFSLIVYDLGIVKTVPTNFTYNIKDVQNENIVVQEKKEVLITATQSMIESIQIPANTSLGKYFIEVLAVYSNRTISTTDEFEVVQPFWTLERIQVAAVIIAVVVGTIAAYYGRKRYLRWKFEMAKYVFPVSYRALPTQKKNAIWLGRIAETNRKAWFYPELLTTHSLISGSTGSGKSVTASIIAEECLKQNIPVVVFDPTAQWTGFVKRSKDKSMVEAYPRFGMDPYDARPFKGMIFEVTDPNLYIDFKKFMNPSEITVFTLTKLKPGEYDAAVWNIVDSIFAIPWEESTELKLLIIFDEVHRLLEKYGGRGGYVALEKAVREFRKWGIGLIMCSQVSSDFKEAIQGNILTEVQMSTKSLTDIRKVESKFGVEYAKRVSREAVGVGMLQNPKFNKGKPYFVEFRPTLHSPHKLTEKELTMYREFAYRLSAIEEAIDEKKKKGEDVFDLELEFKLAGEKLKTGSFRMAEIYLESLEDKLRLYKGGAEQ